MNKVFVDRCKSQIEENNKFINDFNVYIREVATMISRVPSREKSLCLTKLQEANMWLKADNERLEFSINREINSNNK